MIVIISGLYQGESILLPLTSVHGTPCSPVPHGGYQYPPCIAAPPGLSVVLCESGGTR